MEHKKVEVSKNEANESGTDSAGISENVAQMASNYQSNDFVLRVPVLNSIYGISHKEYHMYHYLLAPMFFASLNPIKLILMEMGKSRNSSIATSRIKQICYFLGLDTPPTSDLVNYQLS